MSTDDEGLAAILGLAAVGLAGVFLVFQENSLTSGAIEVGQDQRVIAAGPYRFVRHPMYGAAIVLSVGIPLALESLWGLSFCLPMIAVMVWRLVDEEKYLSEHLPGCVGYGARTRYRLIPGIY